MFSITKVVEFKMLQNTLHAQFSKLQLNTGNGPFVFERKERKGAVRKCPAI